MKKKSFMLMALTALLFFVSCKKDTTVAPQLNFSNNLTEGTAINEEYTITGHITSAARLLKVTLTIEGQAIPFFVDETTAKNKNEYDFSYLVTGIKANTYILVDVYDQAGGKITLRFLIKK
jgi:hypothetical protein